MHLSLAIRPVLKMQNPQQNSRIPETGALRRTEVCSRCASSWTEKEIRGAEYDLGPEWKQDESREEVEDEKVEVVVEQEMKSLRRCGSSGSTKSWRRCESRMSYGAGSDRMSGEVNGEGYRGSFWSNESLAQWAPRSPLILQVISRAPSFVYLC